MNSDTVRILDTGIYQHALVTTRGTGHFDVLVAAIRPKEISRHPINGKTCKDSEVWTITMGDINPIKLQHNLHSTMEMATRAIII